MKIETKFDIGQEVYCIIGYDLQIHNAKIIAVFVNLFEDKELNMVKYRVVDEYGYPYVIPEEQIFKTLEEMKTAIVKEFGLEKWESIVKYYVENSLKCAK